MSSYFNVNNFRIVMITYKLFTGERLDAILETNQEPQKYFIGLQGLIDCRSLSHEAFLSYSEANSEEGIKVPNVYLSLKNLQALEKGYDCDKVSKNIICTLDLKMSEKLKEVHKAEETIFIPLDDNTFGAITDEMTDENFNIYDFTYYPAYLSKESVY